KLVTGVQTCALPICLGQRNDRGESSLVRADQVADLLCQIRTAIGILANQLSWNGLEGGNRRGLQCRILSSDLGMGRLPRQQKNEIGRASCRERGQSG